MRAVGRYGWWGGAARGLVSVVLASAWSGCLYQQAAYDEQRELLRDRDDDGFIGLDDCDDGNPTVYPGAPELCNGRDDDCDGVIDGSNARDGKTFFRDLDSDGWGDINRQSVGCDAPNDFVERPGDCDDFDDQVFPGATERCDGKDTNCDGSIDAPNPADATIWYLDADNDRYGDGELGMLACERPDKYVTVDGDCNDDDPLIHPGAAELCDDVDRNCDGDLRAGALDAGTWYVDVDDDGYGDATQPVQSCEQPEATVAVGGDCDDDAPEVNPGQVERCDELGVDEDCNNLVNEADPGALDRLLVYVDQDEDGWGDSSTGAPSCSLPADRVAVGDDCDDADPLVFPGAAELVGDGLDQSCDGNDACWQDLDNDGFGGSVQVAGPGLTCDAPGLSVATGDCNDAVTSIFPGATEVPGDGIDQDCDSVDLCYRDDDGDFFGVDEVLPGQTLLCTDTLGLASQRGDCNDAVATVYPGAPEVPGDGIDQRCDGVDDCFQDLDDDGFGAGQSVPGPSLRCEDDPLLAASGGDCAPADPLRYPGATEVLGDGVDQDCDGVDACFVDADSDGFGGTLSANAAPGLTCALTEGVAAVGGDYADDDDTRSPAVTELWYDGVDQDCSGTSDFDQDGDGVDARTFGGTDCDDLDATVKPGQNLVLRVPESFETIAEAVSRACDSDRVRVNDGVYAERLDLRGRGVTVEARVPGQTILDAGRAGRAVELDRGALVGLVIRRGRAADGACVRIVAESDVRLEDVRFEDCVATGFGGAVFATGPARTTLTRVVARDVAAAEGAFLWSDAAVDATDVSVRHVASGAAYWLAGASTLRQLGVASTVGDALVLAPSGSLVVDQVTVAGLGGALLRLDGDGAASLDHFIAQTAGGVVVSPSGAAVQIGFGQVLDVGATPFVGVPDPIAAGAVLVADPGLVRFDVGLAPTLWDLRLRPFASARFVDAAAPNPDGSAGDLGQFGGPLAPNFAWYADLDADGLPDGYEAAYGLDAELDDAGLDPDADGLSNAQELAAGTLPLVADTDGDGVLDGAEQLAGTNPLDPASR